MVDIEKFLWSVFLLGVSFGFGTLLGASLSFGDGATEACETLPTPHIWDGEKCAELAK